jgi:hypothetical protein
MNSHLSTCVGTQSPKYLEMAQGHISLSVFHFYHKQATVQIVVFADRADLRLSVRTGTDSQVR